MRSSVTFSLFLAALLFGLLLVGPAAVAGTSNCPPEPVANTPIATGQSYAGSNCTLNSPTDVDSFVFNGVTGQTVYLAVAINGATPTNICLALLDPSFATIFSACSSIGYPKYQNSVVIDQKFTATGTYTIDITEPTTATLNYGISLERLYPFPPNAQKLSLNVQVPGAISPLTDTDAFTFDGVTTGKFRVSATLTGQISQNLCMNVYAPDGSQFQIQTPCTSIGYPNYRNNIQFDFIPPQAGIYMPFLYVLGNAATATYTMQVSCLGGNCLPPTQAFTTLHMYGSWDGAHLAGGLVQATDGNLYGTTTDGGARGAGTVFKMSTGGAMTTLYSFCSQTGCADGLAPQAGLIQATDGNLYGTTASGGVNNHGTVFKITTSGALTTLYSFDSTDGANPVAGLVEGTDGDFYGTTYGGGSRDRGTVFKITPSGGLTTLYSFCTQNSCTDGIFPQAGLVQANDGNFYGTTYEGGTSNRGTVFKITPTGTLTPLHSFNFADGVNPKAGLIQATDGNLYGTTFGGGSHGWGSVFRITLGGALTTLYSFGWTDGASPAAGLVQATDGNFYGTTYWGGARGTIFEITPSGTLTKLYGFTFGDGANPAAGLIQATDHNFYGTTFGGGSHDFGAVFKLATGL